jgi:hypothetical protein
LLSHVTTPERFPTALGLVVRPAYQALPEFQVDPAFPARLEGRAEVDGHLKMRRRTLVMNDNND